MTQNEEARSRRRTALINSLIGVGGILGLLIFVVIVQRASSPPDEPSVETESAQQAESETPSLAADEPSAPAEQYSPPADAEASGTIFDTSANSGHMAYYAPSGSCYALFEKSTGHLIHQVEGDLGRRASGYEAFPDGAIIDFQDGGKVAVWLREIDCKDPQYDPLDRKTWPK